jgi:hypothetical protein
MLSGKAGGAELEPVERCLGYGSVSPLVFDHAQMRMAETRSVNREMWIAFPMEPF